MESNVTADGISYWQYVNEFNPLYLNYICVLNSRYPIEIGNGFSYCELGCGIGVTLNGLAELFPKGNFVGIDNNIDYIESANILAKGVGSSNVDFSCLKYDDLSKPMLPDFDFIVINDIYSWNDENVRRNIQDFIANHLKKNGILYLNYEALPGSASIGSLREIVSIHTNGMATDKYTKAQSGLDYLNFLAENNSSYFAENVAVNQFYKVIKTKDIDYVSHRFFGESFKPFYFHQIEKEMFEIGLSFSGSAFCHLNFIDLAVSREFQEFLKNVSSREQFESHGDVIRNQISRKDVFLNSSEVMDENEQIKKLSEITFGLTCSEGEFENMAIFGDVELSYNNEIFTGLVSILARTPMSVAHLSENEKLKDYSQELLIDALKFLSSNNQVIPVLETARVKDKINLEAQRYSIPSKCNIQFLKNLLFKQNIITLISIKAGIGIDVSMADALFTLCLAEAGRDGVVDWILQRLMEANQEILSDSGSEINTMKDGYEEFHKNRLPQLLRLGIIEPIGD